MQSISPPESQTAPPVPVPVPVVIVHYCPRCGGRGHVSNGTVCYVCNRAGTIEPVQVRPAAA